MNPLTQSAILIFQGLGLAAMLMIAYRAGKVCSAVDDIRDNHIPHIYDELKELRKALLRIEQE